ncbi:FkbM family methyltransferase [Pelotomaculum isophthalicicum JI]|uniref:FkbM family methyltransferase n=1 Tax=Pelotomaculum isophthalicicum JI TaxID=947010 RepID=A0A9X4JVS3_9FIRM|nr:FkbM family methyltransferase [Pelotomaculum isophthalicicum]MDF9407903.1 FkbM family methyltransferase [Pelotomaculum isophthalicicum JI]
MHSSNINGMDMIVPKTFEGVLPVSPNRQRFDFEPYAFIGFKLSKILGGIVFDIGASYGVMTTLLARLVGEEGQVHSFEANADVIEKEKEIVMVNNLEDIVLLNNIFVGDKTDIEVEFYAIPGYKSVASTGNASIINKYPDAEKRKIQTVKIDDYCIRKNVFPDLIKIDIEGAEYIAVLGMTNLLSCKGPDIVIETHGEGIKGIGGSLNELVELLDSYGYCFLDLKTGKVVDGEIYSKEYKKKIRYILASKKIKNDEYRKHVIHVSGYEINELAERERQKSLISEARKLIDNSQFNNAELILNKIVQRDENNAEAFYLLAFCMHMNNKGSEDVIKLYNKSLEMGFNEFWIRYNRGSFYFNTGNYKDAKEDLLRALQLDPNHPGVKNILNSLEEVSKCLSSY